MLTGNVNRRRFALGGTAALGGLCSTTSGTLRLAEAATFLSPLVRRRLFFGNPERSSLRMSPNGTRLAWLAPLDGILNLWVAPIEAIDDAKAVTRVADRAIERNFEWAWTDRHIVFFRDHDGDENMRAASVDVETGITMQLTPERGVRSSLRRRSPQHPTEMLFLHNARDRKWYDLYRIDIVSGHSTLAFENEEFAELYPDDLFNLRFALRTGRDGSSEILERKNDGSWVHFIDIPPEDIDITRIVSIPLDPNVIYLIDSRGRDKGALFEQNTQTSVRTLLVEDPDADISGVVSHPTTRRPFAAVARANRSRWHLIDQEFRDDLASMGTFAGEGEVGIVEFSKDGRLFLVFINRDNASGEYVLYDRRQRNGRPLFRTRPQLDSLELRPMQSVVIPARDGLALPAYLTLPSAEFRNGPLMLLIHGGPWSRDYWGYNSEHQWLANRGYAALSVNFRGSAGFGKSFISASDHEWGGRMQDDLTDAVEWAIGAGLADRTRVGCMGASYGGYSALSAATRTPEVFACIVDMFGISNLITFMGTIPPYWETYLDDWKRRVADPATQDGLAWLIDRSPLTHVDRIQRPLLIAQGMNDVRVLPAESEQIVRAMQERSIPVIYVTFADEGHGFLRQANRIAFYAIIEQFLSKHLGGQAEPIGDALTGSSLKVEVGRHLVPG